MARMSWQDNASRHLGAKRALGNGRWDRVLKERITELSEADTYNEAKLEWRVTGRCWWGYGSQSAHAPDWVEQTNHVGECLCGHRIVYHYEIENTENGVRECLGSDHITSYLILRGLMEETGLEESEITEEMIQEWINVRVKSMKADAWWHENGEEFEKNFNLVKDMDLRINVNVSGKKYFDKTLKMERPVTKIRKRSSGRFPMSSYKMASIVWRWNHPDNPKNQKTVHGYPNDKLVADLNWFVHMIEEHRKELSRQDALISARLEVLADAEVRFKDILAKSVQNKAQDEAFKALCESQDLPYFDLSFAASIWEESFIRDMRLRITEGRNLTDKQADTLWNIVKGMTEPATEKQINYLRSLGYRGDYALLTKQTASREIQMIAGNSK
tara:strand:- start:306 stop:1466 length:1161 start_codon:yes stop_codon:yes gene_type:complete